ncbi:MAG: AI-2E family transporter [Ramlibacter sp.]|jgi:predicted PurR-regulated permease PerM|nr:AI-2E family transporter [Ramlibacter sp.]
MQEPNPLVSPSIESRAFIWLLAAVTLAFGLIIWPFSGAVLWALFIAIVFMPLQRRLHNRWRRQPNLAALVTLAVIVLIVIIPMALITASLAQEASGLYERIRSGELNVALYFQRMVDALPAWLHQLLDRFGLGNLGALQQKLVTALAQSGQALTTQAFSIGQNTLEFVVSFFIMLYLLFFLLRDGPALAAQVGAAVPLNPVHRRRLFGKFVTVVRATVKGNILVAMIQGALGGIAFAVLGIPGALLWGTVMAFLSLLPAVGAALVWGPVAIYFLATGAWAQAAGLIAWGVLAIGLVDNLLRPFLVGKDTKMPDYLVLLSTVGGMGIFGINGFVVGPVIAAMFIAAWDIFTTTRHEAAAPPASGPDNPASSG